MPLRGDLGSIDLAHVFQLLTLNEEAGVLEIFADGVRTLLYFGPKGVQLPYDPRSFPERVARLMQRRNQITPEQVSRARAAIRDQQLDLLRAIVQTNAASEEDVIRSLREQTEEDIYELFVASDASFEFREGELPPPDKVLDDRCLLSGNALILEAARRIDDWGFIRRMVPNDGEIYEPVAELATLTEQDRDDAVDAVFDACDGIRSVSALIEETHLPRYTVCKKLAILVEQGVMAPVPPDVLLERANQCMHSQRVNDALKLYEKAISGGCRDPALPEMAGLAYQSVLEYRLAGKQYAIVAEQAEAAGNLKLAVEMYLRVREMISTDIESRRKLLDIHARAPELFSGFEYDALSETIEVALILRELSRTEESLKMVREGTARWIQDGPAALRLADLSIELGDPRSAVDTLINVGDRMCGARDFDTGLRIYRRAKAIDPQHVSVTERLGRVQDRIHRRQRRRRTMKSGTVLLLLLAALATAYGYYAKHARDAYRRLPAEELASRGNYQAAIASYARYRREYPLTPWSLLAREKQDGVDLAQRRHLAVEQDLNRLKVDEQKQAQQSAENLVGDARRAILASQPDQGLDLLRKARSLATDERWLKSEKIDEQIASLESYFQGAKELRRQADAFRAGGDVRNAHAALVELAQKYPLAPEAEQLRLPVMVSSEPTGAFVRLIDAREISAEHPDGLELVTAATPALLDVPARGGIEIEVSKTTYQRERRKLDPLHLSELSIVLRKTPLLSIAAGIPCAFVAPVDDDHVLIAASDGRMQLLAIHDGGKTWQASFPDLEEPLPAPMPAGDTMYLVGRRGTVVAVALGDGAMSSPHHLMVTPTALPVRLGDRIAIAGEQKLVVVGTPAIDPRYTRTFESAVRGVFAADQRFLVWLDDDRLVSCRALDGGDERTLALPSHVSAVHVTSSGLVACGTKTGELILLDQGGTPQWRVKLTAQRAVTDVRDVPNAIVALCGGVELVAVGPKGERLGSYGEGQPLRVANADGPALMAATSDSRILRLQLPSLVLIDEYSVTGHLRGVASGDRRRVFFGTEEGTLHVFQIAP